MFIRTKKIKKKEYAYLVSNRWTKKGARQKILKYLGRAYSFKRRERQFDFDEKKDYGEIVYDLIRWELLKNDFKSEKNKKNILFKKIGNKKIKVDLNKRNVFQDMAVLKNNEGFLCNYTIKKIFNFDLKEYKTKEEKMFEFAKAFVDSGIKVPKEVFISLFTKL